MMSTQFDDDGEVIAMVTTDELGEIDESLKPKPPPKLAPRGIRTFTVCRQSDETGVSGEGVVIEGVAHKVAVSRQWIRRGIDARLCFRSPVQAPLLGDHRFCVVRREPRAWS